MRFNGSFFFRLQFFNAFLKTQLSSNPLLLSEIGNVEIERMKIIIIFVLNWVTCRTFFETSVIFLVTVKERLYLKLRDIFFT